MFFFGIMEILFDAAFAFGDRKGLTYHDFRRGKKWKERFAFVMDVNVPPASEIYVKLLRVQERYRNSDGLAEAAVCRSGSGNDPNKVQSVRRGPLEGGGPSTPLSC